MASSLLGWIWKQEIGATAKLVLFALNEHTNIGEHGDWRVYPSQDRIAKMCGVTKPTVIKAMKELTEAEIITVAHQHDAKGRQLQNLYWLQAPKLIPEGGSNNFTPQCKNVTHGGKESLHNHSYKNPSEEKENNKKKKTSQTKKIPPTLAEVSAYCADRNNGIDAQHFLDYYEARGWMSNKTKIKCWESCVRTWEKNNKPAGGASTHQVDYL